MDQLLGSRPLESDVKFCGSLVEEQIVPEFQKKIHCVSESNQNILPPIPLSDVTPGSFTACDLHISVKLKDCNDGIIEHLKSLKIATIEKPASSGKRCIHTVTLETEDCGKTLFGVIVGHFSKIMGFQGKIVLEKTTRYLRMPENAPTLPVVKKLDLALWLSLTDEK